MPTVILILNDLLRLACSGLAVLVAVMLMHDLLSRAHRAWTSWRRAQHDRRTYRYTWTKHPHWLRRR